ncbi:MAG: hypothetical protein II233_04010 [Clostridia bacterium]|nr:hypothetical protein [Clostridia bacterium]
MTTGALQGLLYCGNILIPSLFPFMVLSAFIVTGGFADIIGKYLSPVTKRIFHTGGATGGVILLGMCGGFPVGAKGVATLYNENKIDLDTAKALSMFLVGGGPGFVVCVVGGTLYNSVTTGLILWASQLVAQIILGIFACRKLKYIPISKNKATKVPLSNAIVEATESGIHSIFLLCGMVIIFSSFFGLCEDLHITDYLIILLGALGIPENISQSILNSLWEVTKGCSSCCDLSAPLWLTAFALGWGGICVHFQVYSLTSSINIPKTKFTLYRLAQGVISAIISAIVFTFYTPSQATYNSQSNIPIVCNSYIGSIALVMMCIIFTLSVSQKSNISKSSRRG